jgi:hypothetical protein
MGTLLAKFLHDLFEFGPNLCTFVYHRICLIFFVKDNFNN